MIGVLAFVAIIMAGWMGLSGWLSIPLGITFFIGQRLALPERATSINAMGIPFYILVAFLLMKLSGFIAGLFA